MFKLGGYVFVWVHLLVGLSGGLHQKNSEWTSMKPEKELISDELLARYRIKGRIRDFFRIFSLNYECYSTFQLISRGIMHGS